MRWEPGQTAADGGGPTEVTLVLSPLEFAGLNNVLNEVLHLRRRVDWKRVGTDRKRLARYFPRLRRSRFRDDAPVDVRLRIASGVLREYVGNFPDGLIDVPVPVDLLPVLPAVIEAVVDAMGDRAVLDRLDIGSAALRGLARDIARVADVVAAPTRPDG